VSLRAVAAVGESAGDLPMLRAGRAYYVGRRLPRVLRRCRTCGIGRRATWQRSRVTSWRRKGTATACTARCSTSWRSLPDVVSASRFDGARPA
jgi:hypothetical protein